MQAFLAFPFIKESGLFTIKIGRFPVQTPLGAGPDLGTQLCYDGPGDLKVEIVEMQWFRVSEVVPLIMAQSWP